MPARFWFGVTGAAAAAAAVLALQPRPVIWRQASFAEFRRGTLEDGGANVYISARGAVELVNRWDYNNDGNIDLLFVGTHDPGFGLTEARQHFLRIIADG